MILLGVPSDVQEASVLLYVQRPDQKNNTYPKECLQLSSAKDLSVLAL